MAAADDAISRRNMAKVRLVTWAGLAVNLALTLVKLLLGLLGNSQAVVADAVHSLSDMVTDVAVLVGVRFWTSPPDESHPFGHRRIETLVTLGIGVALALVAFGIGYKAISTVRDEDIQQPMWFVVIGPALSIVLKELLYRWTARIGRQVRSAAVVANAWHHRSDAVSSIPALVAVVVSQWNPAWAFVDHVGALVVSLFILKVAWDVTKPTLLDMSGQAASRAERQILAEIASGVPGVQSLHALRTRKHSWGIALDLHIIVAGEISVREGHNIAEEVKRRLLEEGPSVADAVVHVEPDGLTDRRGPLWAPDSDAG